MSFNLEFSSLRTRSCWWTSRTPPLRLRLRISLRCWTSFWSLITKASSAALTALAYTFTMICLARSANFNVEIVSGAQSYIELIAAIKVVLVLPPRESCKSLVILESLYGIWSFFFPWARAEMTFPRDDKLRFIVLSSAKCWAPIASSFAIFSLPAKSHKLSLPRKSMPRESGVSLSTRI